VWTKNKLQAILAMPLQSYYYFYYCKGQGHPFLPLSEQPPKHLVLLALMCTLSTTISLSSQTTH
jgi:hypothetical protein